MKARFDHFMGALAQTRRIAEQCESALPDGKSVWPVLKLPAGQTPDAALEELVEHGLHEKYRQLSEQTRVRAQSELSAIARHGYAPLFLLVAEIVRYARGRAIPISTRGSVANSLVAFCAGITSVDPVAHELLFERFLNPERADPPDIDLDLCSRRRDEVLDYVRGAYGADHVALVATVATMRPKSAVRETAKVLGLDEATVQRLVNVVRDDWHPDPRRRGRDTMEQLRDKLTDPQLRAVVETAYTLVGLPHHLSVHAGGLVVTPGPLTDYVPVQWAPKGFLITQFGHVDVEMLGLPKIDLLGIRALTVLADAVELVRRTHDSKFRLEDVPEGDPATAALLSGGATVGVFQCESSGARRTLRQLKAHSVHDLAIANAFFKPGPATGGMALSFVRRYRNEEKVSYLHPALIPILAATQGVLLFQEQILRVAREIAGLTWGEADRLRRGMSKFQGDEMAAMQDTFVRGCLHPPPDGPGFNLVQAQTLWEQVQAFAGYGFNQGHATAYADLSYRSAYLKAHWPAEFMCARLADWGGFHHQSVYIAEAVRLGIAVRPPHVNHSRRQFRLEWLLAKQGGVEPVLWMGLGQVRDLRRVTVEAISGAQRERSFCDLHDLVMRVPLHKKELVHLIQCGALDGMGSSRTALLDEAAAIRRTNWRQQLAFDFVEVESPAETATQRMTWEQRILGQPVSVHPLQTVDLSGRDLTTLADIQLQGDAMIRVAGIRLPGRTGGRGWFLSNGQSYVMAMANKRVATPRIWKPVIVEGAWRHDEWGGEWLQVVRWSPISKDS